LKNKNKYDMSKSRSLTNAFPVKEYEKLVDKLMHEDKLEEAIEYLKKLMNHKESYMYYLELGLCYLDLYDYENTIPPFMKCYTYLLTPAFYIRKESDELIYDTVTDILYCYFKLKQYDKVIDFCKNIEPNHKAYKAVLENYAVLYFYLNDIEKMNFYLDLLYKKDPKNTQVKFKLAQCYFEKGDFDTAVKYFDDATKEDLSLNELFDFITGVTDEIYCKNKIKYCEMYFEIVDLRKVITTDLNYGEILDEIISCYYKLGNNEKTIEYFEKLKIHHDLYDKERNYQYLDYLLPFATTSYLKLNKYDELLNILNDLIKQGYGYYIIYLLIAVVYYFKKDFNNAIEYCKKIKPNNNFAVDLIVLIIQNAKNNNFEQIKKDFEQYIENNKDENGEFIKKLSEIQFDENYYNNIILICLTYLSI